MLLLIYEDGSAKTLDSDLLPEHMDEFNAGALDVFDLSRPVTRLTQDLNWEAVEDEAL